MSVPLIKEARSRTVSENESVIMLTLFVIYIKFKAHPKLNPKSKGPSIKYVTLRGVGGCRGQRYEALHGPWGWGGIRPTVT